MSGGEGLVVGKFYPPHRGHQHLIEEAIRQCDRLTILVCGTADQDPAPELRAGWLAEMYPQARVLLTPDDLPEEPEPWARRTVEVAGRPDVVFTSEHYGDAWAAAMNCRHILVDAQRSAVPCSGTAVRRDPMGCWELLHPIVRAYYVPRVCVLGAESTGTTTLAQDLAIHFQTNWVPEYGRLLYEGRMHAAQWEWIEADFDHIAQMQDVMEDWLARSANRLLVCDTNSFATNVWKERYLAPGLAPVRGLAVPRRYVLHILTSPDIPFVQDGTRDGEHLRHSMHERFRCWLERSGYHFVTVSGSRENRLQAAIGFLHEAGIG